MEAYALRAVPSHLRLGEIKSILPEPSTSSGGLTLEDSPLDFPLSRWEFGNRKASFSSLRFLGGEAVPSVARFLWTMIDLSDITSLTPRRQCFRKAWAMPGQDWTGRSFI